VTTLDQRVAKLARKAVPIEAQVRTISDDMEASAFAPKRRLANDHRDFTSAFGDAAPNWRLG